MGILNFNFPMVRYSFEPADPEKSCKVRSSNIRCSYKNTRETVNAIKGMNVSSAIIYMNRVLSDDDIIPFRRHNGGVGRHAQCKKYKTAQGRRPEKSIKIVMKL